LSEIIKLFLGLAVYGPFGKKRVAQIKGKEELSRLLLREEHESVRIVANFGREDRRKRGARGVEFSLKKKEGADQN